MFTHRKSRIVVAPGLMASRVVLREDETAEQYVTHVETLTPKAIDGGVVIWAHHGFYAGHYFEFSTSEERVTARADAEADFNTRAAKL